MRSPYGDNNTPYYDDFIAPSPVEYDRTTDMLNYLITEGRGRGATPVVPFNEFSPYAHGNVKVGIDPVTYMGEHRHGEQNYGGLGFGADGEIQLDWDKHNRKDPSFRMEAGDVFDPAPQLTYKGRETTSPLEAVEEVYRIAKHEGKIRQIDTWLEDNKPKMMEKLVYSMIYEPAFLLSSLLPEHRIAATKSTGSMEPLITGGNLVVLKKHNGEELEVGDIITFRYYNEGMSTIHRISEINENGIVTSGDAVGYDDPGFRTHDLIDHKYIFQIPLGKIPFINEMFDTKLQREEKEQERINLKAWR